MDVSRRSLHERHPIPHRRRVVLSSNGDGGSPNSEPEPHGIEFSSSDIEVNKPLPDLPLVENSTLGNSKFRSRRSLLSDTETKLTTLSPAKAAYSKSGNSHTHRARLILEKPNKIFAVGEGCGSCIANEVECVWSNMYTRCARCTWYGVSTSTCGEKPTMSRTNDVAQRKETIREGHGESKEQSRHKYSGNNGSPLEHDRKETIVVASTKNSGRISAMKRSRSPSESTETPSKRGWRNASSETPKSNTHNFFAHLPRKRKASEISESSRNETSSSPVTPPAVQEPYRVHQARFNQGTGFGDLKGSGDRADSAPARDPRKQVLEFKTGVKHLEDLIAQLTEEKDRALAKVKEAQEERDQAKAERDRALERREELKLEIDRAIAQNYKFPQSRTSFKPLKRLLDVIKEYHSDLDDLYAQALDSKGANLATIYGDIETKDHNQVHPASAMQDGSASNIVSVQGGDDTDSDDEDIILNYRAQRRRTSIPCQAKLARG